MREDHMQSTLNETMPNPTSLMRQSSTKGQIIHILSEEPALTVKEIYNRAVRQFSYSGSYQAVHKAVKELILEGVLQKTGAKINISYGWARKAGDFSKKLESSFREKGNEESISNFTFGSYIEFGKFIVNSFLGYPNPEKKDCLCFWKHAYPLAGVSQEEHELMKQKFHETTHYAVCNSDTFLDRMTQDYVSKLGKKAVTGRISTRLDTFVTGDYVMQAYFPPEFENEFEELYRKTKSEKDLDMQRLFEFGCKKHEIKAVIFKNKGLADKLRQEAKGLFEKKGARK